MTTSYDAKNRRSPRRNRHALHTCLLAGLSLVTLVAEVNAGEHDWSQ